MGVTQNRSHEHLRPPAFDRRRYYTGAEHGVKLTHSRLMETRPAYDKEFRTLSLVNGKANGKQVKEAMMKASELELSKDKKMLGSIWGLADIDKDGEMDSDEFAICMYLIDFVKEGNSLPTQLPIAMCPLSKYPVVDWHYAIAKNSVLLNIVKIPFADLYFVDPEAYVCIGCEPTARDWMMISRLPNLEQELEKHWGPKFKDKWDYQIDDTLHQNVSGKELYVLFKAKKINGETQILHSTWHLYSDFIPMDDFLSKDLSELLA